MIKLYSIYDKIADEFGFPFDAKNDDVAIRKFNGFIRQINSAPNSCVDVSEFQLYHIGEYDNEKGVLYGGAIPNLIDLLNTEVNHE